MTSEKDALNKIENLFALYHRMHDRWVSTPSSRGIVLSAKMLSVLLFAVSVGLTNVAATQIKIYLMHVRLGFLKILLVQKRSVVVRDPYLPPRAAQALLCFFTPAKHRETAVVEMQLGYEFNVDRIGLSAARLAYWWELARNTYAFCGGLKFIAGTSGVAAVAIGIWARIS